SSASSVPARCRAPAPGLPARRAESSPAYSAPSSSSAAPPSGAPAQAPTAVGPPSSPTPLSPLRSLNGLQLLDSTLDLRPTVHSQVAPRAQPLRRLHGWS